MSGLFGKPANSATQEVYAGIQVGTSTYGQCVPYVAGRTRISSNLGWYGLFKATPVSNSSGGKGGGGGGSGANNYSAAWLAILCIGPITGINQIWHDKTLETLTSENLTYGLGTTGQAIWSTLSSYTPPGAAFTASIAGRTMTVTVLTSGNLLQGQTISGTGVTSCTITSVGSTGGGLGTYQVSVSQTISSRAMTASAGATGSQAVPYSNSAWVASPNYNLGGSASMPNLNFEVDGVVAGFSIANGMYDADPSAVIVDYLTNAIHGAGFQGPIATLTGGTNTYQAYVMCMNLLISPTETTQRQASDYISEVMQITNSDVVLSAGVLKVIPYYDSPTTLTATTPDGSAWSYTPNLTPQFVFTDNDYKPDDNEPPVKLIRKALSETYNMVQVEYLDRQNYYNEAPAGAQDDNDISLNGPRVMSTLTFHQITNSLTAQTVAQLLMQASLYERNTYEFKLPFIYGLLEPMDFVSLTDAGLGLVGQLVRILEVTDDGSNVITIKAMEVTGVTRTTPVYNWNAAAGYAANYNVPPGNVSPPAIFQMPPVPQSLSEGITIGIAVCGLSSSPAWNGCQVLMSIDGGNTYAPLGLVGPTGPGRYGTLTAGLAADPDPDTTSILSMLLANTTEQMDTSVTHANADNGETLCLVGSGATVEVIAFGTCALTGPGAYNLSYLRRGLYGTSPQVQVSGAPIVRLDGAIFQQPIDPGYAGATLYFKFLSINTTGSVMQLASAVTAYTYTVPVANPVNGTSIMVPRGNTAVTPSGLVYKAASAAYGWDSDAYTPTAYPAISITGQFLAATNPTANGASLIGLASAVGSLIVGEGANYNDFYGFYPHPDSSNIHVGDGANGTIWTLAITSVSVDTLFEVTYDGFTIRYYYDGALVTSSQHQGLQLYGYICIYYGGQGFSNVDVQTGPVSTPSQFVATGGSVVNDTNATKISGPIWSDAVYSVTTYPTCHITAQVNALTDEDMIGLALHPVPTAANIASGSVYVQANYAWYLNGAANAWVIYESGTAVGSYATPALTDTAAVTYDGSVIRYYLNGVVERSITVGVNTYYGFVTFGNVGDGVNSLRFGPTTSLALPLTGGAALLVARGSCVLNGQMAVKSAGSNVWDGDAVSATPFAAGAIQAQNRGGNLGVMALGFVAAIPGTPTLQPDSGSGNGYYGIYVHNNNLVAVANGVVVYTQAPANNDLYLVTYDGFSIRYYINSNLVYTLAAQLGALYFIISFYAPQPAAALVDIQITTSAQATPSQFVATGNCTVNDTNATKTGGVNSWDSCVYSVLGYTTCHITAKANATGDNWMMGLAQVPVPIAANVAAGDIYQQAVGAIYNAAGTWYIYESGISILNLGPVSLSDTIAITYDGNNLTYWLNGTTVRVASYAGVVFYGFCPFWSAPAAGINSLRFGPTTNLAVADTAVIGANAATIVTLTTNALASTGHHGAGGVDTLNSITVGPYPYASTVVLTLNATWQNSDATHAGVLSYFMATTNTGSGGVGAGIEVAFTVAAGGNDQGVISVEATTTLAANTTQTYYAVSALLPSSGVGVLSVSNITTKAEAIKR